MSLTPGGGRSTGPRRQRAWAAASRRPRPPQGWPLIALLGLYPLWWALGLGAFTFLLVAVPMAWYLARHRPLRAPPGFGLWLLFLLWAVVSLVMLPFDPPGTAPGTPSGRMIGIAVNLGGYLAATIVLLYVVNLPHGQLSQQRLLRLLSVLFAVTVAGGLLGVLAPRFEFVAPLETLLPERIRANDYTQALVHPTSAQIQDVLGADSARPAAPWGYTNFWGNNFSILLVWFLVLMWASGSGLRRIVAVAIVLVALVPVVHSLDRALWLGLGLSAAFVLVRLAVRGRLRAALVAAALVPLGILAFTLTPLHGIVQARLADPGSIGLRNHLSRAALDGAAHSPVIGYGGTRKVVGSPRSISTGPTPSCPNCGQFNVGSNGQFWLVVFSHGFVGAALYIGFFLRVAWAFWRDRRATAGGGVLVVLLSLFYMFFYSAFPVALILTMISIGLMARDRVGQLDRSIGRAPPPAGRSPLVGPPLPLRGGRQLGGARP